MKTMDKVALVATIGILATILMASAAYAAAPELRLPYMGGQKMYISQAYGVYTHTGIDYYALDFTLNGCDAWDKPVLAVADGTITKVDPGHSHGENNYGNNVIITHEDGYTSLYGHLNQILVQKDQKVAQGTIIGTVGNTGFAPGTACALYPGTHLHFRILYNGAAYKPEPMSSLTNFVTGQWSLSNNYGDTWNFNTHNNFEGWKASNVEDQSVNGGRYFINPQITDPYIYSAALSLNSGSYDAIEINMASNAPDGNARIYFKTESSPSYSESKMVEFKVNNNGNWQTYTIYMANHNLWQGTITGIRIDPAESGRVSGIDTIGFDWIKVIKTDKKPSITASSLDYSVYNPRSTVAFAYWIKNPFANDLSNVRLGAQIRTVNPQGNWLDNSNNDKVITLNSGTSESQRKYERLFKLSSSATAGYYDAHWVILKHDTGTWFDHKEKANAFVIESSSPIIIPTPTPTPTPTDNPPPPTPTPTTTPTPTATPTPSPTPTPTPVPTPMPTPSYDPSYENSIVANNVIGAPNWWLKDSFRRKIVDDGGMTWQWLYRITGNKYLFLSSTKIEKIPQGPDIEVFPYDPIYEGSIVLSTSTKANWWLKDNFKRKIVDEITSRDIYYLNGNKFYGFSDANINKIPPGEDIKILLPADQKYIYGIVVDSVSKNKIVGATVSINAGDSVLTNADGYYAFRIEENVYNLSVKLEPAYYMNTKRILMNGRLNARENIELVKKV